ncbi:hypothetical protein MMPV_007617 [Pyropia vietnamensis]
MAFAAVTPGRLPPGQPLRRLTATVRGTSAPAAINIRGGGHGGGGGDGDGGGGGGGGGGTLTTFTPTRRQALGMAAAAVTTAAAMAVVTGAAPPSMAAEGPPVLPSSDGGRRTGLGDRLRAARQEAFADAMDTGMEAYEAAVAGRKGALLREAFRVAAATREGTSVAAAMKARSGVAGGDSGGDGGGGGGGGDDGGETPAVRILDVGVGTAPNVGYYPRGAAMTGVDPSAAMTARAVANTRRHRPDVSLVTFPSIAAAATAAASAGTAYDVAVCTLTLCSVDDPAAVVAAVAATLRPGGVFVFVEHVGARPADGGSSAPAVAAAVGLRVLQTLANPAQMVLADGCHLTRDAEAAVRAAAPWAAVTAERFRVPGGGALLISPHVAGLAVKAI